MYFSQYIENNFSKICVQLKVVILSEVCQNGAYVNNTLIGYIVNLFTTDRKLFSLKTPFYYTSISW